MTITRASDPVRTIPSVTERGHRFTGVRGQSDWTAEANFSRVHVNGR